MSYFSDVSSWLDLYMNFLQEYHRSDVSSFSVQHIRKHIISICPIIGDVNFDCLVKAGLSRFLYSNIIIVINKFVVGTHFETVQI